MGLDSEVTSHQQKPSCSCSRSGRLRAADVATQWAIRGGPPTHPHTDTSALCCIAACQVIISLREGHSRHHHHYWIWFMEGWWDTGPLGGDVLNVPRLQKQMSSVSFLWTFTPFLIFASLVAHLRVFVSLCSCWFCSFVVTFHQLFPWLFHLFSLLSLSFGDHSLHHLWFPVDISHLCAHCWIFTSYCVLYLFLIFL